MSPRGGIPPDSCEIDQRSLLSAELLAWTAYVKSDYEWMSIPFPRCPCLSLPQSVPLNRLVPRIVSGIDMVARKGYDPDIVAMDGHLRYHEQLFNSEDFLPAWSQQREPLNWPGFEHRMEGRIHRVPVFAIDGMPSNSVLLLDLETRALDSIPDGVCPRGNPMVLFG